MKKVLRLGISLIVTFVLVYFLLSKIRITDIIDVIRKISLPYLFIGISLYVSANILRAVRFHLLLNRKITIKDLIPITFFYNFANTIIPFRVGELSYVYLLKKTKKTTYSHGLSTLIVSRIFDFSVFIILLLLGMLLSNNLPTQIKAITPFSIIILSMMLVCLFFLIVWNRPLIYVFEYIHRIIFKNKKTRFQRHFHFFMNSFREMESGNSLFYSFIFSVCIGLLLTAYTMLIVYGLNYTISLDILFLIICLSSLSGAIPITGVAGFGTTEGVLVVLLSLFGYNVETAIVVSFSIHIVQLTIMSLLGFVGWIRIRKLLE